MGDAVVNKYIAMTQSHTDSDHSSGIPNASLMGLPISVRMDRSHERRPRIALRRATFIADLAIRGEIFKVVARELPVYLFFFVLRQSRFLCVTSLLLHYFYLSTCFSV